MDPPNSFIYAEYLFQAAVVDEIGRDRMLDNEEQFRRYVDQGDNTRAWQVRRAQCDTLLIQCVNYTYITQVRGCVRYIRVCQDYLLTVGMVQRD